MSKANGFLNKDLVPIDAPMQNQTKRDTGLKHRMPMLIGMCFFISMLVVGPASAEINTTAIMDAISAFTDIIPGITDMITSVVPAIMTLAIVGFVLRFFNEIISMISSVLKF